MELIIVFLIWINLRGVKESVMALTPIFIAFILSHVPLVFYGVGRHLADVPALASLSFLAGGITLGYVLTAIRPVPGKTLNAVLIETLIGNLGGPHLGGIFVAGILATEAVLLFVAAQARFVAGPPGLADTGGAR